MANWGSKAHDGYAVRDMTWGTDVAVLIREVEKAHGGEIGIEIRKVRKALVFRLRVALFVKDEDGNIRKHHEERVEWPNGDTRSLLCTLFGCLYDFDRNLTESEAVRSAASID